MSAPGKQRSDTPGLPYRQVTIQSISETLAQTVDRFGAHIAVSTLYRRGGGPYPREGEVWIIDRTQGFWTFASKVVGNPPVITGSHGNIPALVSLLAAMDDMGLILDQSDGDPLFAVHPHTHTDPQGGTTAPDVLPPSP